MTIHDIVAWNISKFRTKQNLSQEALAFRAGFQKSYISQVELGLKKIGLTNLEKIAKALDKDIKSFVVK